jgi:predicted nucleic acid-binding protein
MKVVVDASSMACLFLPDEDSRTVEQCLHEAEIVAAPKLAIVETAAAFYRRSRKGSLTLRQADAAAASWRQTVQSGGVVFYEDAEVLSEACVAAGRLNHALQDCIYLELARMLSYTLVTGDRVFATKAAALYANIVAV